MGAAQIAHYFWQHYFGSLELVRYCGEQGINPLAACCLLKCFAAVT